jgi:hypothetical protein
MLPSSCRGGALTCERYAPLFLSHFSAWVRLHVVRFLVDDAGKVSRNTEQNLHNKADLYTVANHAGAS